MQLPMATPAIMLGINQTVLLVLSMVVIAGLTGSGALGLETVYGLTKGEVGRGVAGGVSIVLLAIALDRITQAWGNRPRQHRRGMTHDGRRRGGAWRRSARLRAWCSWQRRAAGTMTTTGARRRPSSRPRRRAGAETTAAGGATTAGGDDGDRPATGRGHLVRRQPVDRVRPSTRNVAKIVLESELGTTRRAGRHRRERHVARPGRRRPRRRARGVAVRARRGLRDVHRREGHGRRPRRARARRPRSAGTCRPTCSRSTRSWRPGRAAGPGAGRHLRHRRVRRPGPVPDGRPELRQLRRADHRQPRAAAEVRRRRFRGRRDHGRAAGRRRRRSRCCSTSGSRTGCTPSST